VPGGGAGRRSHGAVAVKWHRLWLYRSPCI
jgi:hypothetical protein